MRVTLRRNAAGDGGRLVALPDTLAGHDSSEGSEGGDNSFTFADLLGVADAHYGGRHAFFFSDQV